MANIARSPADRNLFQRLSCSPGPDRNRGGATSTHQTPSPQAHGPKPATIDDVARLARVSRATVSYVLSRPKRVAPATRARVLQAIEQLGFVANAAARQLGEGRSRALGMLVSNLANPFFEEVARGADDEARKHDHVLLLVNSRDDADREREHIRFFDSYKVNGVLAAPVADVPPELLDLAARGTPFVSIGQSPPESHYPAISGDNTTGGRLAIEHLIAQGRQRLLFIGGPHPHVALRAEGARQAARAASGVRLRELRVDRQTAGTGRAIGRQLLGAPAGELPDGIFAGNDLLALGILHELLSHGVRIPHDVSLVGYDDIEFARIAIVPLTSVRHPSHAMGQDAVAVLLGHEKPPASSQEWNSRFAPELIIRETTLSLPPDPIPTAHA